MRIFSEGGSTGKSLNIEQPDTVIELVSLVLSLNGLSRVHHRRRYKKKNINSMMEKVKILNLRLWNGTINYLNHKEI